MLIFAAQSDEMKQLLFTFLLFLAPVMMRAQGSMDPAPAQLPEAPAEVVATYRADIAAKVNNDPAKVINFNNTDLGVLIYYCESVNLTRDEIVALLEVKVRRNWLTVQTMTSIAEMLSQKFMKNEVGFQDGWSMSSAYQQIQDSLLLGKRLPVTSYLTPAYIEARIAPFEGKASYLVTGVNYTKFIEGKPMAGFPDGQFVSPPSVIDGLLAEANGDIAYIEVQLGIPAGGWQGKGGLYRIDIPNATALKLRLPDGGEMGANEWWIPGGYTSGGMPEGFVNQIPKAAYTATKVIQ
jgi:hypothetical protein